MTARAAITASEIKRRFRAVVEGARAMGWADGSYTVEIVDNGVRVLPIAANAPSDDAQDMERRMREAFGR